MEIVTLAPQVPVTMMIIITDIEKGTGMVGKKELIIDHNIGPLQVVLIEIISENDVSTLEKEDIHPIPIITKVGQYQYHQEGHICILQIHIIIELTLMILVDKSCLLMRHIQKCRFRTIQIMLVSLTCPRVNHVLYCILGL